MKTNDLQGGSDDRWYHLFRGLVSLHIPRKRQRSRSLVHCYERCCVLMQATSNALLSDRIKIVSTKIETKPFHRWRCARRKAIASFFVLFADARWSVMPNTLRSDMTRLCD